MPKAKRYFMPWHDISTVIRMRLTLQEPSAFQALRIKTAGRIFGSPCTVTQIASITHEISDFAPTHWNLPFQDGVHRFGIPSFLAIGTKRSAMPPTPEEHSHEDSQPKRSYAISPSFEPKKMFTPRSTLGTQLPRPKPNSWHSNLPRVPQQRLETTLIASFVKQRCQSSRQSSVYKITRTHISTF